MNTQGQDTNINDEPMTRSVADQWIISLLQEVEGEANQHLKNYRFDLLANILYEFTWNEYCDWYLEFSKPILQAKETDIMAQRGTRSTLVRILEALLRLLHPIMPFITEELWQRVAPLAGKSGETIMLQPYPQPKEELINTQATIEIEWIKQFILGVRRIRAEMDISPSKPLPILIQNWQNVDQEKWQLHQALITRLAHLANVTWLTTDEEAPESAMALVDEMQILIPLAGLIDKTAELQRLNKEIDKIRRDLTVSTTKLDNPKFTQRAPTAIVEKERQRVAEMTASLQQLEAQAAKIMVNYEW
jgi:valyl-tRNA synthetase